MREAKITSVITILYLSSFQCTAVWTAVCRFLLAIRNKTVCQRKKQLANIFLWFIQRHFTLALLSEIKRERWRKHCHTQHGHWIEGFRKLKYLSATCDDFIPLRPMSFIASEHITKIITGSNQKQPQVIVQRVFNIPCLRRGLREAAGLYQSHLSFRPWPWSQTHEHKGQYWNLHSASEIKRTEILLEEKEVLFRKGDHISEVTVFGHITPIIWVKSSIQSLS